MPFCNACMDMYVRQAIELCVLLLLLLLLLLLQLNAALSSKPPRQGPHTAINGLSAPEGPSAPLKKIFTQKNHCRNLWKDLIPCIISQDDAVQTCLLDAHPAKPKDVHEVILRTLS